MVSSHTNTLRNRQAHRSRAGAGLRAVLRSGGVTIGSWITLAHPAIAEILANAGFDWLAVDLEHSVITIREAEELIRVIELSGAVPLVRLTANDPAQIKRVMDAGAHGIIVPMVNSRAEAEAAVAAVHYPPRGRRGVGLARAQGYGTRFEAYRQWLAHEAVTIVQIEHIDAVDQLESILTVEGVDGYLIGPYDLSASLGHPGQFGHPSVVKALKTVRQVARRLRVPGGVHVIQPDIEEAVRRIRDGFTFVAYSLDMLLLGAASRQGAAALHAVRRRSGRRAA